MLKRRDSGRSFSMHWSRSVF